MVTIRPSQLSKALGVPAEMRGWDRSWGPAVGPRIDEPTVPENQAQNGTGGSCPFSRTPEVAEGMGKANWSRIGGHGREKLISLPSYLAWNSGPKNGLLSGAGLSALGPEEVKTLATWLRASVSTE